ncbi:HNH endonuclease [Mycoplasmatota bacterium WC30]
MNVYDALISRLDLINTTKDFWWVPKHTPNLEIQLGICKHLEKFKEIGVVGSFKTYFGRVQDANEDQYRKFDISRYLGLITNEQFYRNCNVTKVYKDLKTVTNSDFSKISEYKHMTDKLFEQLSAGKNKQPYIKMFKIFINYIENLQEDYISDEEFYTIVCTTWTKRDYLNGLKIIQYVRDNNIDLDDVSTYSYLKDKIRLHKYFEQHSQVIHQNGRFTLKNIDVKKISEEMVEDEKYQNETQDASGYKTDKELNESNNRIPELQGSPSSGYGYKKDPKISKTALKKANYLCEYAYVKGLTHHTFTNKRGHQYSEGHHLIPMSMQSFYGEMNIDRIENIVSLCPICHRQVHYGDKSERKKILEALHNLKESDLRSVGLEISIDELLSYY